MTKLALSEKIGVSNDSIRRWEDGTREPRTSDLQKLSEVFGVPVDELLNGPAQEEFRVTLKFVETLEGVNEVMDTNGIALTVADNGFIGVSGGKKFETREDIEPVMADITDIRRR